jgi:FlaG/FlaF family flagellin (archaellin)
MIDLDDGDQLLNLFGIVLVLALVGSLALVAIAATSVQQQSTTAPEADWTLTRINESHVRISHAGGDPVRTDRLSVAVDGTPHQLHWSATMLTEEEYGIVRAGEHTTVTLLWQRSEADRKMLKRWSLPESTPTSFRITELRGGRSGL